MYLYALRIAREACGLSMSMPACYLHPGPRVFCRVCSRVLCCYRTDHVVSAAVPSGTLFLLLVRHYFSFFFRSSSILKLQRKCACRIGGRYAARAFRLFRLGRWTSEATAIGQDGGESSSLSNNSERETCFAETAWSMSAEPPPSEDTSTTSSYSESAIIADSDTALFCNLLIVVSLEVLRFRYRYVKDSV